MSDELVFYTHPRTRGRIVRWMLEEVGQPYRTEILDLGPAMKTKAFRAVNPMGKVPAITHGGIHGGTTVTETAAICAYLADAFPQAGLAPPPGDPMRGPYYRWLFFAAGPMESAILTKMIGAAVPSDRSGAAGFGSMELMLDTLEGAVSTDGYLAGSQFSAADLYLASHIGFGLMFGMLERRPAYERFFERMASRPAAVRARRIDDDLLATMESGPPA